MKNSKKPSLSGAYDKELKRTEAYINLKLFLRLTKGLWLCTKIKTRRVMSLAGYSKSGGNHRMPTVGGNV